MSGVDVRGNERSGVMQHKWFVRRNGAGQSIWRCTGIAVAITTATLLSGCTQLAPAPTDPLPASPSPAPDAVMDQHSGSVKPVAWTLLVLMLSGCTGHSAPGKFPVFCRASVEDC